MIVHAGVVACVCYVRTIVIFAILFALCKINLFSVKPLWGFYFGIIRDDVLAVIVFQKNNTFLIVSYHYG
jgi:hypothetical protein